MTVIHMHNLQLDYSWNRKAEGHGGAYFFRLSHCSVLESLHVVCVAYNRRKAHYNFNIVLLNSTMPA